MARLNKIERAQMKEAAERRALSPPPLVPVAPRAYLKFSAFAARFNRSIKPVRFIGDHWKL
jgi:hypothetical protein